MPITEVDEQLGQLRPDLLDQIEGGVDVNLLVDAGLLRVVRTRRVRAIDERYGRVARTIYIGPIHHPEDKQVVAAINGLAEAPSHHQHHTLKSRLRPTTTQTPASSR